MMFTPRMIVAVRTINLLRRSKSDEWLGGWIDGRRLKHIHGVRRVTLKALKDRGVVRMRICRDRMSGQNFERWSLSPLALAILEAGRA